MNTAVTASSASAEQEKTNIHALSAEERNALMRAEFQQVSRFQRAFGQDAVNLDCADHAAALRDQVLRLLALKGVSVPGGDITRLHESVSAELKAYGFNDGVNKLSTLLYDTDDEFLGVYHRFIKECVGRYFPYPFYFQATTTIRLHCPGGENAHHYPRYHTDIGYGHPPQEINLWLPLTEPQGEQKHGFRRMSVEQSRTVLEPFSYDFTPFIEKAVNEPAFNQSLNAHAPQVDTPFGQMHVFDSRCIHTGEPLRKHTRASIDIRILPVADYNALPVEYQGTGRRRIRYIPGHGYYPHASDTL